MGTVTGAPESSTRGVGTGSTVKGISASTWADAVLTALGAPITSNNIDNLTRMVQGETAGQQGGFLRDNNPLNVNTWGSSHSTFMGGQIVTMPGQGGKTVWVQQYDSVEQGVAATVAVINQPNNAAMKAALLNNSPTSVFGGALAVSSWKGAGYASAQGILKYLPFQGAGDTGEVGGQGLTFSPSLGAHAVAHAFDTVRHDVAATTLAVPEFLAKISNTTTLKSVGIFLLGGVLVVGGFVIFVSQTKGAKRVEVAAAGAA